MKALGKTDRATLQQLFSEKTGAHRSEVLIGPSFGVDTALIDLGEGKGLAIASDPLSFIPSLGMKASAWLSVHLMANDIATTGYLPEYAQFVLNLPNYISDGDLKTYWQYIHHYCKEIGVAITGGHTGFDNIGPSTISGGGTMFAKVDLSNVKSSAYAKPEQSIIMTKSAALSSSAILAMSFPKYTRKKLGEERHQELTSSFYSTSVLDEIKALNKRMDLMSGISALHDVTEGGILGAIYELCEASKIGADIYTDSIKVGKGQKEICQLFDIDPLRSIGAGSLLIVSNTLASQKIVSHLRSNGIKANIIGQTTVRSHGIRLNDKENVTNLEYQDEDPYWKAFFNAMERKLE